MILRELEITQDNPALELQHSSSLKPRELEITQDNPALELQHSSSLSTATNPPPSFAEFYVAGWPFPWGVQFLRLMLSTFAYAYWTLK